MINMRYYLAARRYQFYFRVVKIVFYEYMQRERNYCLLFKLVSSTFESVKPLCVAVQMKTIVSGIFISFQFLISVLRLFYTEVFF